MRDEKLFAIARCKVDYVQPFNNEALAYVKSVDDKGVAMTEKTKQETTAGVYRTADAKAQINWSLEEKENGFEFSASGTFDGGSGQCIDSIAKAYPEDKKVQEICAVWRKWHLNGMNAGTTEQTEWLRLEERRAVAKVKKECLEPSKYFYDQAMTEPNWHALCHYFEEKDYYSWVVSVLKQAKLYEQAIHQQIKRGEIFCTGDFPEEVKTGVRGYRYGERWLFSPIPESVLAQIRSWSSDSDKRDLQEVQVEAFMDRHGIRFKATRGSKAARWQPSGYHYRVSLVGNHRRLSFDFWDSRRNMELEKDLTAGSVFSCIASEIYCPETYEEFVSDFGFSGDEDIPGDVAKNKQLFARCHKHAERLRDFFGRECIKELDELRG